MIIEVPDMYWACKQFVEGKDNFKEFYLVGSKDHYFGNGRATDQRWGILTTFIFGNQNGDGQFHYNGYTEEKLLRIADILGFSSCNVEKTFNKGGQVLVAIFIK